MRTAPVSSSLPREFGFLLIAAVFVLSLGSRALAAIDWLAARLPF